MVGLIREAGNHTPGDKNQEILLFPLTLKLFFN
jgi:hypothetical protein